MSTSDPSDQSSGTAPLDRLADEDQPVMTDREDRFGTDDADAPVSAADSEATADAASGALGGGVRSTAPEDDASR